MTINPRDQTKGAGVRFPYKESPGTGKIKWLEIVLVLPHGIQEGRVCGSKIFWCGKGHSKLAQTIFFFYLECDCISYPMFPNATFSYYLDFTDFTP